MAYFSSFPSLTYDFTSKTDAQPIVEVVTDISTRVGMVISDADFENMCQRYVVRSGELPEHVSQTFYNTPDLAWTVFYINNLGDINSEWPLSDSELSKYITNKYGVGNELKVHHYEKLPEGIVMDQAFIISTYGQSAVNTVTNTDYEIQLNELKRLIYVIKPENIASFVSKYTALITG